MKTAFAVIALFVSITAISAPIKTCKTTLNMPESDPVPTLIEISDNNGNLIASTTQTIEGETMTTTDSVETFEEGVRAGLNEDSDPDAINRAEALVVHAMTLENDPVFQGAFRTGVALKKVRSAKVFVIGETTNMGSMSVVEAKDEKGKVLGSFVGGFLISACKK